MGAATATTSAPTTSMFWTFADHQGTIRDIVSGNAADRGKVVEHRQYDSFGKILARTANAGVAFGYTGRPIDEKTGLSDYRARWYDANTGRFINEDPSGFAGGDTNLFRYVGNDPLDRIDPSGLTAKWAGYGGKGSVPAAGWGAYGLLASGASSPANTFTGKSDRGVPFGEFLVTRSSSGAITPQSSLPDTRSLSGYDRVSLGVHGTLSIAGAVPLFGIVPDAIDWAYTAAELPFGKSTKTDLAFATAGIAATAAPFIGDGAAAALKMSARVARIGGNTASDVVRVAGRFDDVARVGKNAGVAPNRILDAVEGTGRHGGNLYDTEKLAKLQPYLERRGVALKVGDDYLPPNMGGGFASFENGKAELVLRSNPTEYEVWHELSHYVQWKKIGPDAYRDLPRWTPKNPIQDVPEQFVFDFLENSKDRRWYRLNFDEQQYAIDYIQRRGGSR